MKQRISVTLAAVMLCSVMQPAAWVQSEGQTAVGETASVLPSTRMTHRGNGV